jgi:hypothetical protein
MDGIAQINSAINGANTAQLAETGIGSAPKLAPSAGGKQTWQEREPAVYQRFAKRSAKSEQGIPRSSPAARLHEVPLPLGGKKQSSFEADAQGFACLRLQSSWRLNPVCRGQVHSGGRIQPLQPAGFGSSRLAIKQPNPISGTKPAAAEFRETETAEDEV